MGDIPKTMRAVQLMGHGDLNKLVFRDDIPVPIPGPRDALIKVSAAGVNNTDLNTRLGWYSKSDGDSIDASWSGNAIQFPRIQGADVCGQVVAVGEQANSSLINKRVLVEPCILEADGKVLAHPWYFGSECDGGFAEYTVVAARHAFEINSELSDIELASFPCSYSTAENLLTRAKVNQNDVVLVTGASGGVGSAVIQLAKARGSQVIGITSPSKAKMIQSLGADRTLARNANPPQELGKSSVDVVIDLVAGNLWPSLLEVLKPFGRYAVAGAIAGPLVELDVRTLYLKDLSFFGCTVLDEVVFPNLIKRIEAGQVSSVVAGTFSLYKLSKAQEQFQMKDHVGKLVIDITAER